MRKKKIPQRRELNIVIIEDDPLALNCERVYLNNLQNYNGFRLQVWGTVNLKDGLEKCAHDTHPADAVILELSLLERTKRNIPREIKRLRPDVVIIGIASHIERYTRPSAKSLQVRCVVSKDKLNHELPRIIDAIYREKTPRRRLRAADGSKKRGSSSAQGGKESSGQLSCSRGIPYCQTTVKRNDKPLNGFASSDKTKNAAEFAALGRGRIPTPRNGKCSQRSEISLRESDQRKHNRDFSESRPKGHDLAAERNRMKAAKQRRLPVVPLTPMELRVVELSRKGLKPREVARQLGISVNTIYSHRNHIKGKCHTQTWTGALLVSQRANGTK
ncbi:LuxR C-terminal-related transcriptional regulator [Bifidobacterium sp. ESL0769]|uniref:DNA-binding response regulator n=1 Tax=Bifidobacterium sp. ESL0769 TaxID=2983229 RepID=UPI0023F80C69|nr:LuxR C-terminal-related transcriptional regulator [Bifidobacterium sp. ESL0769]WEV67058.1 LuxR C-terminal-related transcriptional regulator [Bifidobacterium sp. ESL0769]